MVTWTEFYNRFLLPEKEAWTETDLFYAELLWAKDILSELHGLNRIHRMLVGELRAFCPKSVIDRFNAHFYTMTNELAPKTVQETNVIHFDQKRLLTLAELQYLEQLEQEKTRPPVFSC